MLQSFTRNYNDNSTDAGFQFTFNCDVCNDGVKTSFIESSTYKKGKSGQLLGQGAGILGSLLGGAASNVGWAAERGSNVLSQKFDGQSPEWQKEHEKAFEQAMNEAKAQFHRCPNDNVYVCDQCYNEDAGMCTNCAGRQEVMVGKAHADAMKRNIDEAGQEATVWQGKIESKTTMCPQCGKPAGAGKHCNNCGASMELNECPKCGARVSKSVKFCGECGEKIS